MNKDKISVHLQKEEDEEEDNLNLIDNAEATFEEAIEKTGFGKFNYVLITLIISGSVSAMFESTSMSYIFAGAQCDLNLSLDDKGLLNSITYAGMISTSFVWGILLDKYGRKRLMVYGYLLNALCIFISGFTQNFEMLLVCKFFGGVIINGPFTAMIAYLGEFHSSAHRSKIQLLNGAFFSLGQILLPVLAWLILPLHIEYSFFDGLIKLHPWNFYLFAIGLAPFISGIIFIFLPESPKFLMTCGENEKALNILRNVYSVNTGNTPESYPVKKLIVEKVNDGKQKSLFVEIGEQFATLGPLFRKPLLSSFILLTASQVVILQGLNMLRLWFPQLFQSIEDYKMYNNGTTSDLCTMLEVLQPLPAEKGCITNIDNIGVYLNSIIVACSGMCGYFIIMAVVNFTGKKTMLKILSWTAGAMAMGLYFAQGTISTTVLASLFVTCGNICATLTLAVGAEVFPTGLRAFTVSSIMAAARLGAMTGNLIVPLLLGLGCAPMFFVVAGYFFAGGLLAFTLPNTEKNALV